MEKIRIQVNGKEFEVDPGQSVLQACESLGVEIPRLCWHPRTKVYGGCRLCVVEIEGMRGLPISCGTEVKDKMVIRTDTPAVHQVRRMVVELMIASGEHNCMVCEKNGDCTVQRLAYQYGIEHPRFDLRGERIPIDEENPFIVRDYNKCVLCGRCVRVCNEVVGQGAINLIQRGARTKVATFCDTSLLESVCAMCGNCVQACPTGALAYKKSRFQGRRFETEKINTTCPYCGCGCQLQLHVKNGRVIKVEADETCTPNYGLACAKGRFGYDFIYSPDRLTRPLLRKGQTMVEVSWEEALDYTAARLQELKQKYGPDALMVASSAKITNEGNYAAMKFTRAALGTNNIDHCARLCHASTVTGLVASFGSGAMTNSIAELEGADVIMVVGSNTTETHPLIGSVIKRAVRKGSTLIVVDPRKTEIAELARLFLRPRVGTDIALFNAMMHVIIKAGLENKEFIAAHTEGYEEMAAHLKKYPPEWAEKITGVPAALIEKAARTYATAENASVCYTMGVTQHTCGVNNVRTLANLVMLCGQIGRPSTGLNPLRGQNNVQGACDMGALPNVLTAYQRVDDPVVREKFEKAWGVKLPEKPGLALTEAFDKFGGQIKAFICIGENPALSEPDIGHARAALSRLEFLAVLDIFQTETAEFADVVFPCSTFAERDGTYTNTERRVLRVRKAVYAPGEVQPVWWILNELGKRMGVELKLRKPQLMWDEEISELSPSLKGIKYFMLEKGGVQWPKPSLDHPGTPYLHKDGNFSRGKGRFAVIEHTEPAEVPDRDYPFWLTTGRRLYQYHTSSMTRRAVGLNTLFPEDRIEISPEDAEKLGIKNGDQVKVSSRRGELTTRAWVTDRVSPKTVFLSFHFWEANANVLTHAALDPQAKIPEYKACAVRVERA